MEILVSVNNAQCALLYATSMHFHAIWRDFKKSKTKKNVAKRTHDIGFHRNGYQSAPQHMQHISHFAIIQMNAEELPAFFLLKYNSWHQSQLVRARGDPSEMMKWSPIICAVNICLQGDQIIRKIDSVSIRNRSEKDSIRVNISIRRLADDVTRTWSHARIGSVYEYSVNYVDPILE